MAELRRCETLAQLTDALTGNDVLFTELAWLSELAPAEREALGQRATMAAHWVVLIDANARMEDQIAWQRLGVSHFFQQPLNADLLPALIDDIRDRQDGPPVRVVLLVDEERSLSNYLGVLRACGIEALPVQDPLLVLDAIADFKPDLMLVDINMEVCSGVELAAIVHQRQGYTRLPVVFLETLQDVQHRMLTRAETSQDFLIKTTAPDLQVAAIKSMALRYRSLQRLEALRQREEIWALARLEQLRVAVDEHAIISIADVQGNILHVNDRFCEISGYSREDLLGQNHRMVKSATHPPEFYRELWRTIGAGKTWHGEVCNQRNNGELYWVDATIVPFLDDQKKPTQYISIRTDITSLKHSEEALRLSDERFCFAVEGAGDGIWDWNIHTGELLLSGHYETMLGFGKGELEPTIATWNRLAHTDDRAEALERMQDYLSGKSTGYDMQMRLRCKDGGYKWVLCRGTIAARDELGNPLRAIGIHSDISERKAVEVALVEARESAERANHAKSAFLSSMSHELRTPMNAILGFSQMLEYDAALNADQLDNVHEILKGGRHLLALINEVLDLAKIESGRIDLSLEPVELACLAEDCRQLIQPLAAVRQIALRLEVPPETIVRADRTRLKQVLLNLLSNAIKYNRECGETCMGVQRTRGGYWRITVTDTGTGIAPERMAELFQPFSRLVGGNSEIEGTGIGLTITRQLVELMGGQVGVESQVGVGSVFWIELPSDTCSTQDASARVLPTAVPLKALPQQYRVLCIDDNPVNLKLITQLLRLRKHIHLITAHSPDLGIEMAIAHRPDLILLDINMPGMDGYQVLDVLKGDPDLKSIPVIAVTANAMRRDIERGLSAGFSDYLTKPIDTGLFLKTIDDSLIGTKENTA